MPTLFFAYLEVSKILLQMTSYLLLRDNKESGPYTAGELEALGLKPYDLIWVQGKSAAWRYPGEIEELKSFAPAVEEQPYDRFFRRKPVEEKREERQPIDPQYSKYIPQDQPDYSTHTPKRSVFVTLPGNKQVVAPKPEPVREAATVQPSTSPVISVTENTAAAEIKYSQPLDEIKEMYVKTLLDRKDKKIKKSHVLAVAKKAAVFGGLIILGVLAGFFIWSRHATGGNDKATLPDLLHVSTSPALPGAGAPVEESVHNDVADLVQGGEDDKSAVTDKVNSTGTTDQVPDQNREEQPRLTLRKETMMIVPKRKPDYASQTNPGAILNPATGERERSLRNVSNEIFSAVETSARNSLKDLVSVASNDYKRVAFGGIRDLQLTITNKSRYELDKVVVELQYLKPSEEPLRTENINFESIAPNSSVTIRVPDTNRGIKVQYRIVNIKSQQDPDLASGQ